MVATILLIINWKVLADSSLSLVTHYYNMAPGLTITKPILAYEYLPTLDTTVNAKLTVDRVVTDFDSIDAISGASQTQGSLVSETDVRQEYLADISHITGNWTVSSGFLVSLEGDYRSYSPSFAVARDFNQRNTTLSIGYAHNYDSVHGRYMPSSKEKDVDNFAMSLTQILSRNAISQIGFTRQYNEGFLGTGNRQLVLDNDAIYPEYLPSVRTRDAIGFRVAYWFDSDTTLKLSLQTYKDDWELSSNTFNAKLYQRLNSWLSLRGEYRHYSQSNAYFIKNSYTGSEQYLSSASALASFYSDLYGIKMVLKPELTYELKFEFKYEKYRQSKGLTGDIFMLSGQLQY